MKHTNNGLTQCHDLVCILKYKHSLSDEEVSSISEIENHKGNWTITFTELPTVKMVVVLVAVFENELSYDNLSAIVYDDERFEWLAGTEGNNIESLISLLAVLKRVSI